MSDQYIRRTADRRGLRVWKSKARDPHHENYGRWWVCRVKDGAQIGPMERGALVALIRDHDAMTRALDIALAPDDPE
jgi:hypothetical protein